MLGRSTAPATDLPFFAGVSGAVHYRRWPVDDAPLRMVFLHGMRQHSGNYHRFGRALGRYGIELWALDHVGHGLSEGEPGHPGPIADLGANAVLLAELAEGLPLVLMGHSLGAAAALAAAAQSELFTALILCGTPKSVVARAVPAPTLPTLIVHGIDDRLAPIDILRQWTSDKPSLQSIEYADAGHDLLHEPVHAQVTADIAEFATRACL